MPRRVRVRRRAAQLKAQGFIDLRPQRLRNIFKGFALALLHPGKLAQLVHVFIAELALFFKVFEPLPLKLSFVAHRGRVGNQ